jgi:kinesin family protein 5
VDSEDSLTTKRWEFAEERSWHFDHVLDGSSTQDDAYSIIARSAVADVVTGLSHTILAYGQTGSGKTHTIFGPESFWSRLDGGINSTGPIALKFARPSCEAVSDDYAGGIVGRAVAQMFRYVAAADAGDCFRVLVSFFEIHNENVHDLLGDSSRSLSVRENKESGVFVESLQRVAATSSQELLRLVAEGISKRTLSNTVMNRSSSRSHAFLVISFDHKRAKGCDDAPSSLPITRGVLTIVDLAGSERVGKSGSLGSTLSEAKSINKSLTILGMCIAALSGQRSGVAPRATSHVPLRDSKLTRLLRETLEGRTRTTLVVTVSPMIHNFEETKSSLQLGQRAMGVQCSSSISFVPQDAADGGDPKLMRRIFELEQENERLRQQLEQLLQRERPSKLVDAAVQHCSAGQQSDCSSNYSENDVSTNAPSQCTVDEREAAVVSKLSAVIQHLQQEIARSAHSASHVHR